MFAEIDMLKEVYAFHEDEMAEQLHVSLYKCYFSFIYKYYKY